MHLQDEADGQRLKRASPDHTGACPILRSISGRYNKVSGAGFRSSRRESLEYGCSTDCQQTVGGPGGHHGRSDRAGGAPRRRTLGPRGQGDTVPQCAQALGIVPGPAYASPRHTTRRAQVAPRCSCIQAHNGAAVKKTPPPYCGHYWLSSLLPHSIAVAQRLVLQLGRASHDSSMHARRTTYTSGQNLSRARHCSDMV